MYDFSGRTGQTVQTNATNNALQHLVRWTYNTDNNLSSVEETFDGGSFYHTSYTYDTDNRPTILSYGSITGENSYDAYGRLWSNYLNHTTEGSDEPVSMVMTTYGYTNPDDTHTSTQIRRSPIPSARRTTRRIPMLTTPTGIS